MFGIGIEKKMAENSKIEWCHHTANFWIGCHEVSPECDNCYARVLSSRYGWAKWGVDTPRHRTKLTVGKLKTWDKKALEAGERHRVFVNSLSDICDSAVEQEWRNSVVDYALQTPNLDYLLLTKRPANIPAMFGIPPRNFWMGTTVGVKRSLYRIDRLRESQNFTVKFLSCEPLLEDLGTLNLKQINWVIVGGESGGGKRSFNPDWARSIRDQCKEAGVAFFMKQWDKVREIPEDLMIREFPTRRIN